MSNSGTMKKESPLIEIIKPGEVEADFQGIISELDSSQIDRIRNYGNNLMPRLAVAWAVINFMKLQDGLIKQPVSDLARHRRPPEVNFKGRSVRRQPSNTYPVHALVVVDGVEIGVMMRDLLNLFLEQRRSSYPLEEGYRAVLAVGGNRGDYPKLTLGDAKHPWMLAKGNAGNQVVVKQKKGIKTGEIDLAKTWARICIVDNLAREGINNPLCGVIGFASPCNSQQEAAQRIGRVLRSWVDDSQVDAGLLLVPPKSLDEIKVFLHSQLAQNNRTVNSIRAAIDYMVNMRQRLEELTTVSDLVKNYGGAGTGEMNTSNALSVREKLAIAYDLGESIINSPNLSRNEAIEAVRLSTLAARINNNPEKREKANNWIDRLKKEPEKASAEIRMGGSITPQDVVRRESRDLTGENVTDEQLVDYLRAHKPDNLGVIPSLQNPEVRKLVVGLYVETYRLLEKLPTKTQDEMERDLEEARKTLANLVRAKISEPNGNPYPPLNQKIAQELYGIIKKRLNGAIRKKLIGSQKEGSVSKKSRYIQPQYVAVLKLENVQRELVSYTARSILAQYCPQFRVTLNWNDLYDKDSEAENLEIDYDETKA